MWDGSEKKDLLEEMGEEFFNLPQKLREELERRDRELIEKFENVIESLCEVYNVKLTKEERFKLAAAAAHASMAVFGVAMTLIDMGFPVDMAVAVAMRETLTRQAREMIVASLEAAERVLRKRKGI